jgi:hypothetical protein
MTSEFKKTFDMLKKHGFTTETERFDYRYGTLPSISNLCIKARKLDNVFFVKFYRCKYSLNRIEQIIFNENIAIKHGFCPEYEVFDKDENVKISKWNNFNIVGDWSNREMDRTIKKAQELHKINENFKGYWSKYFRKPSLFKKQFSPKLSFLKDCLGFITENAKLVNSELVCVHGDLNPQNILNNGSEINFIDWDWSDFCPRLFDLCDVDFLERRSFDSQFRKTLNVSDLEIKIFGCLYVLWNTKGSNFRKSNLDYFLDNDISAKFFKNFLKF